MDRRDFIKSAALGSLTMAIAAEAGAAELFYPTKVDPGLFQAINRTKDPADKTPLEKTHAPYIRAPAKVTAGEPFVVEVSVGENLHIMGPAHWIEYIELSIGNEPAGRVDFQPKGYLNPRTSFLMVLTKEATSSGKVTLVAHQRCNLHGYWEGSVDIEVS